MDHQYAMDVTGPTGLVSEVTIKQSGSEGTASDFVSRVEVNERFSALESSIQHLIGLVSGADHEKTDTVSASGISSPPPLSAGLATLPKTNTAMSGTHINLSSSQKYQGHPATAPSFIKLADRSISASLPYQGGSATVPPISGRVSGPSHAGLTQESFINENPSAQAISVSSALAPVPGYLVDRIKQGQYVDLTLLRPCNLKRLPVAEPPQSFFSRGLKDLLPIRTFQDWSEAWAVFGGVYSKFLPDRAADMFSYFLLISSAHRDVPGIGWLEYDVAFRKHVAEKISIPWGEVMPTLWMTTVVAGGSQFSSHLLKPKPLNICYRWNSSHCPVRDCKFAHICLACRGPHPKTRCDKDFAPATQSVNPSASRDSPPSKKPRK
eukprot:gene1775-16261_t